MSELVDPAEIERIVGVPREQSEHIARAVTADETVYLLHSQECLDSGVDLRDCEHSIALDKGILPRDDDTVRARVLVPTWRNIMDQPCAVDAVDGRLLPAPGGLRFPVGHVGGCNPRCGGENHHLGEES